MLNMMRRASSAFFLAASLVVHGGVGLSGVWLSHRTLTDVPTVSDGHVREATPTFAGETFVIAHLDEGPQEVAPIEAPPVVRDVGPAEMAVARPRPQVHGTNGGVEAPLTYGAVGDRSAASVLVALSRGFPQAASTDPIWRTAAFGDAGSATLEIELAEDGTLARWSLGPGASTGLRQAMVRTMDLIGGRTFVAAGRITRLHVSARVTADAVRDGADAVYAIHSEHEGETASAYFSLSSGRRVDLVIK